MITLVIGNRNYSSWSLRAWLALRQCTHDFEEDVIALQERQSERHLKDKSPSSLVPVLYWSHQNGQGPQEVIWDSLAIFETLAERFPEKKLWPENPILRSQARSLVAQMHSGFLNICQQCPMNIHHRQTLPILTPETEQEIAHLTFIWQHCLEKNAPKGGFIMGHYSLVDMAYAPIVLRFHTYQIQTSEICQAYMHRIISLSDMQEWILRAQEEPWRIRALDK